MKKQISICFMYLLPLALQGMQNPYQNMTTYNPALFNALIMASDELENSEIDTIKPARKRKSKAALIIPASQIFTCPNCEKEYKNRQGYRIHLKDHTGFYKHSCSKCGYRTNNIANFKRHQNNASPCTKKSSL